MATTPLVSIRGLSKSYPGVVALSNADIDVAAGEILGLVGKNGAGKSTLIKILAGAEHADSGEVRIDDVPVPDRYDPRTAHRLGLAFMHQELGNVSDLTVAENVALGARYPRRAGILVSWKALNERVSEVMQELDVRVDPRRFVADLSNVEQRIVMIARALYHRARLLVLDEPSASLTEREVMHLHDVVRHLKASGRSVVYVTHRLREVVALTDRVVVMQDGAVVLERPTAQLDEKTLVSVIAGHPSREGGSPDAPSAIPASITTWAAAASADAGSASAVARTSRRQAVLMRVCDLAPPGADDGVSFDLSAGEILGFAGLVGSGRTELVRLLFGADRVGGGTIEIGGRRAHIRSPRDAVAAGLALLPEDRRHEGLVLSFSVSKNITLASLRRHRWRGLPFPRSSSERSASVAMIERLAIATPGPEREVRLLSGGNQQKVVLAKWLDQASRIMIFDEPTQGIDVHAKEEIFALIREAAAEGRGTIVISSDFAELVLLCSRVIVLQEGQVSGVLEGEQITEGAIVRMAYGESAP
jgi:ribose transport system ATP-binding protein